MLSQKKHLRLGRHESSWAVIEKWWRRASGYSRLNGTSSPPVARRTSDNLQMKKLQPETKSEPRKKSFARKPSTARPVVIVERSREVRLPVWKTNYQTPVQKVSNINEEFVEVFYWTQSRYNYPGQLERYKKNLCYCCADCPACRQESDRTAATDRHRPLAQSSSNSTISRENRVLDRSQFYHGCNNGNYLRTSYT